MMIRVAIVMMSIAIRPFGCSCLSISVARSPRALSRAIPITAQLTPATICLRTHSPPNPQTLNHVHLCKKPRDSDSHGSERSADCQAEVNEHQKVPLAMSQHASPYGLRVLSPNPETLNFKSSSP